MFSILLINLWHWNLIARAACLRCCYQKKREREREREKGKKDERENKRTWLQFYDTGVKNVVIFRKQRQWKPCWSVRIGRRRCPKALWPFWLGQLNNEQRVIKHTAVKRPGEEHFRAENTSRRVGYWNHASTVPFAIFHARFLNSSDIPWNRLSRSWLTKRRTVSAKEESLITLITIPLQIPKRNWRMIKSVIL